MPNCTYVHFPYLHNSMSIHSYLPTHISVYLSTYIFCCPYNLSFPGSLPIFVSRFSVYLTSYFLIVPLSSIPFSCFFTFSSLLSFCDTNHTCSLLSVLQIRAEAAYLYDAVNLYAQAVLDLLDRSENPRNGTALINAIMGRNYRSAMG